MEGPGENEDLGFGSTTAVPGQVVGDLFSPVTLLSPVSQCFESGWSRYKPLLLNVFENHNVANMKKIPPVSRF